MEQWHCAYVIVQFEGSLAEHTLADDQLQQLRVRLNFVLIMSKETFTDDTSQVAKTVFVDARR